MKFDKLNIDLGVITERSKNTLKFPYTLEEGDKVLDLVPSCGCGIGTNIAAKSLIQIEYIAAPVPVHILDKGRTAYKAEKRLTVEYQKVDGTKHKVDLTFTATVRK